MFFTIHAEVVMFATVRDRFPVDEAVASVLEVTLITSIGYLFIYLLFMADVTMHTVSAYQLNYNF